MAEAASIGTPSLPRVIAIALVVGATYWGGLLLMVFGLAALFPVPFGVGYCVLAGYAVRAVSCPALDVRRLIWAVSIVVQGGWMCIGLADGSGQAAEKPVPLLWWTFATVGSLVALLAERPDQSPQPAEAAGSVPGAGGSPGRYGR